jgi:uncharacterized tellurite resistance protein B-like protein
MLKEYIMAFWDLFSSTTEENKKHSSLHYELQEKFPDSSEEELIKLTCISGLLARVAYVDFHLDDDEKTHMNEALTKMTEFSTQEINGIVEIAINHIKELAGLENHKYVYSLKEVMDRSERYKVVEALFALAASDGVVENVESEEIRLIVKSFDLSDKHFLAARAKVSDKLKALNL